MDLLLTYWFDHDVDVSLHPFNVKYSHEFLVELLVIWNKVIMHIKQVQTFQASTLGSTAKKDLIEQW